MLGSEPRDGKVSTGCNQFYLHKECKPDSWSELESLLPWRAWGRDTHKSPGCGMSSWTFPSGQQGFLYVTVSYIEENLHRMVIWSMQLSSRKSMRGLKRSSLYLNFMVILGDFSAHRAMKELPEGIWTPVMREAVNLRNKVFESGFGGDWKGYWEMAPFDNSWAGGGTILLSQCHPGRGSSMEILDHLEELLNPALTPAGSVEAAVKVRDFHSAPQTSGLGVICCWKHWMVLEYWDSWALNGKHVKYFWTGKQGWWDHRMRSDYRALCFPASLGRFVPGSLGRSIPGSLGGGWTSDSGGSARILDCQQNYGLMLFLHTVWVGL